MGRMGTAFGVPRGLKAPHLPADLFPQDNKREHEEMATAIALRDSRLKPLEVARDEAEFAMDEVSARPFRGRDLSRL